MYSESDTNEDAIVADDPYEMAGSLIDPTNDSSKARYLTYLACGFSLREACNLAHIHQKTVMRWRRADEKFAASEVSARGTQRAELARDHTYMMFTRNYALILEKDYRVLSKAVHNPKGMDKPEHEYLLKARSHYTPQQLQILGQLMGESSGGESFQEFVLRLSRTRETDTIMIAGRSSGNIQAEDFD